MVIIVFKFICYCYMINWVNNSNFCTCQNHLHILLIVAFLLYFKRLVILLTIGNRRFLKSSSSWTVLLVQWHPRQLEAFLLALVRREYFTSLKHRWLHIPQTLPRLRSHQVLQSRHWHRRTLAYRLGMGISAPLIPGAPTFRLSLRLGLKSPTRSAQHSLFQAIFRGFPSSYQID